MIKTGYFLSVLRSHFYTISIKTRVLLFLLLQWPLFWKLAFYKIAGLSWHGYSLLKAPSRILLCSISNFQAVETKDRKLIIMWVNSDVTDSVERTSTFNYFCRLWIIKADVWTNKHYYFFYGLLFDALYCDPLIY